MPTDIIQWFPGHMAKTRRVIKETLPNIDLAVEVLDARIPYSSHNPELYSLIAGKPLLTVLNKATLADPQASNLWKKDFESKGIGCLLIDCVTGAGVREFPDAVKRMLADKLEKYEDRGMAGRGLKVMICGIPNVGKSSLINRLAGGKKAKVENRPGVTLEKQWITTASGIVLLDTPGVLWPKFDERRVGENLAMTGAIRDEVVETEQLAARLCGRIRDRYPSLLAARYKLDPTALAGKTERELFEMIGRKRGFLVSGGEIDEKRTADTLLDEFRAAKIGRITLETPLPPVKSEPAAETAEETQC